MAVAEGSSTWPAMVLVSYPLHPPGRPERLRTAHFPALRPPCLFLSGGRDAFRTPAELERDTAATEGRSRWSSLTATTRCANVNPGGRLVADWLTPLL